MELTIFRRTGPSSRPFGLNPSRARAPRSVFCNVPNRSARALVINGYSAPRPPLAQPVLPQTAASSTIIHRLICHITPACIHSVSCHMHEIGFHFVLEFRRPSDLYIIYVFIIFCMSVCLIWFVTNNCHFLSDRIPEGLTAAGKGKKKERKRKKILKLCPVLNNRFWYNHLCQESTDFSRDISQF